MEAARPRHGEDREGGGPFLHREAPRAQTGVGGDSMSGSLEGKSAVVTGSTKGIGRAIAEVLLESGARVAVSARDEREVAAAGKDLSRTHAKRVLAYRCDVRREEDGSGPFQGTEHPLGGGGIPFKKARGGDGRESRGV